MLPTNRLEGSGLRRPLSLSVRSHPIERAVSKDVIAIIEAHTLTWESHAKTPFESPEPSVILQLEARSGDLGRTVKYLHQQSTIHVEHFRHAQLIRLIYLGRFYLTEYRSANPVGIYSAARAILESHVFVSHVCSGLKRAIADESSDLKARGVTFFNSIRRARLQTTSPGRKPFLQQLGLQPRDLEPYKVADCISTTVSADPERWTWLRDHYKDLCDFVHANLSSQTVSRGSGRVDTVSRYGQGALITPIPTLIGRHEYPSTPALQMARSSTEDRTLRNLEGGIEALNNFPSSPSTTSELVHHTGSAMGFPDATTERRVCPQPQRWNELWELLPERKRVGAGWEPSLPLILGAWWHTSDSEKRGRFLSHLRWAAKHGALSEVSSFVRSLGPDQWHHEGE